MTEKRKYKIDLWPTISSVLLLFVIGAFVYSYSNSSNYKKEINYIKAERDSLELITNKRQYLIDSISEKLNNIVFLDTVQYQKDVLDKIKKQYENQIYIINTNSRNENIELLSRNLSQRSCIK